MKKIVLTGTSYSGKSALIERLSAIDYNTVPEAETQIVLAQKELLGPEETGRWILENYSDFKDRVARRQRELEVSAKNRARLVFYDRSAICYIAYCKLRGVEPPESLVELAQETQPDTVFFIEKLKIFDERRVEGRVMKKEEALKLACLIAEEYQSRGFGLLRVPEFYLDKEKNVNRRTEYILGFLKN